MKSNKKPYLNAELKRYYLDQLQRCRDLHRLSDECSYSRGWAMDERVEEAMQRINRFDCLQTMLSRLPRSTDDALMYMTHMMPPAYVQFAYSKEVKAEVIAAMDEAVSDLRESGVGADYTSACSPAMFDDLPKGLRDIDAVSNQKRYLRVKNYLFNLMPLSTDFIEAEDPTAEDYTEVKKLDGEICYIDDDKLAGLFNLGIETLVSKLEKVGELYGHEVAATHYA